MKYLGTLILVSFILWACTKDKIPYKVTPYELEIPTHFPQMQIPEDNPMTIEGVELGRKLFYETKLSLDNTISCASCHSQENAFSDPKQFSEGVSGTLGNRNSMALINLGWQQSFFWDGRAKTLEAQILEPVPNPIEMHQSWEKTVSKLSEDQNYRDDFLEAFDSKTISKELVSKAIAQFLRTLISANSKYDVIYKVSNSLSLTETDQLIWNQITPEEISGYDLFKSLNGADCFHCHNGALMQVQKFSNNGLDINPLDYGRELITGNTSDHGKFKVPTLRNIALSAPYMHDGRFATLDEVIEQYSTGVKKTEDTDPLIEFAHQGGVQLNASQKSALKAFLLTLTDYEFVKNKKFAKP